MIDKPRYFDALSELVGGSDKLTGGLIDGPMSGIGFAEGISKPTEEAIQSKLAELTAAHDAQAYARNREAEYPTIQELVVALYDSDDKAAVDTKRAAIKDKYPKP